jgi:hypothetical protein
MKELIRLLVGGQSTKVDLAQTRMRAFFICLVSDTNFVKLLFLKPPADRREPPGE